MFSRELCCGYLLIDPWISYQQCLVAHRCVEYDELYDIRNYVNLVPSRNGSVPFDLVPDPQQRMWAGCT